jgi:hypothetical protein
MIKTSIDLFDETCNAIVGGELDRQLIPLKKLLDERLSLLRVDADIKDFVVGDKIVLNDKCGTKYLIGEEGTVVAIRRSKISISFDKPKGRFARTNSKGEIYSAHVVVPISIVDKI